MKKHLNNYLIFGVATGMFVWSLEEFLLLLTRLLPIHESILALIIGSAIGGVSGALFGAKEGFFANSLTKMKRGARIVGLFGLFVGMISFFLLDQTAYTFLPKDGEGTLFSKNLLFSLRWLLLSIAIGLAIGVRDRNNLKVLRGGLSGTTAGFFSLIAILLVSLLPISNNWVRGAGLILFTTSLSGMLYYFSNFKRKEWLKSLNGAYEGIEFELSNDLYTLGTQNDDEISLHGYEDINPTHAKLIKHRTGYSLIDNDPFGRTYVNFRNITEQPLKNGDIIKVGSATFQYCTLP